jgi:hypothetical protein
MIKQALAPFPTDFWVHEKTHQEKIVFQNKSIWWLTHLDDPGKSQGSNLDYVCVDELTVGVAQETKEALCNRLRNDEWGSFNGATNSDSRVHWVYKEWYENPGDTHSVISMTTEENFFLPKSYITDRKANSEQWQRQFMLAEWGMHEGLVYSDFSPARHISLDEPPEDCTWYFGVDFGYHNPFACLLIGIDHDGGTWIVDELYGTGITAGDWGHRAAEWHPERAIRMAIVDPGPDRREREAFEAALRSFGRATYVEKARKNVATKIRLCTEKIQTDRLHIHPRCYNLIQEIQSLPWAKNAHGAEVEKETPDPAYADHALDAWGYVEATLDWLKG